MGERRSIARPRVLVIYPGLIPSVEISVLIPLRYLAKHGRIELHAGTVEELALFHELSWCDIVVFSRSCLTDELPALCKVRQLHIPYIYDLDDNFFRLAEQKEQTQLFLQEPGVMETLKYFISGARVVKTGSEQMVMDMKPYNSNIVIHPYVFDFTLLKKRKTSPEDGERITIGYAGSLVHSGDLMMICDALNRIAQEYPSVRFAFYGARPQNTEMLSGELLERCEFIPFQRNYAAFIEDLSARGWTIALAPLKDSVCNRSKTDNKYREYAACGIVGVYSRMPLYDGRVRDGVNGMLAEDSARSWYEKLSYLLDHPGQRRLMARRAYEDVSKNNRVHAVADRWLKELILPNLNDGLMSQSQRRSMMLSGSYRAKVYAEALSVLPLRIRLRFAVRCAAKRIKRMLHI